MVSQRMASSAALVVYFSTLAFFATIETARSTSASNCSAFDTPMIDEATDSSCLYETSQQDAMCSFNCLQVDGNALKSFRPSGEARCLEDGWDQQVCVVQNNGTNHVLHDLFIIVASRNVDEIVANPNYWKAFNETILRIGNVSLSQLQQSSLVNYLDEEAQSGVMRLNFTVEFSSPLSAAIFTDNIYKSFVELQDMETPFMNTFYEESETIQADYAPKEIGMVVELGSPFLATADHRDVTTEQALEIARQVTNLTAEDGNYSVSMHDPWYAVVSSTDENGQTADFKVFFSHLHEDENTTNTGRYIDDDVTTTILEGESHSQTIFIVVGVSVVILCSLMGAVAYMYVLKQRRHNEYKTQMALMQLQTFKLQQRNGEALFTTVTAGVAQWLTDVANGHMGSLPMWCIALTQLRLEKKTWPSSGSDGQGSSSSSSSSSTATHDHHRHPSALSARVGNSEKGSAGEKASGSTSSSDKGKAAVQPGALCHESYRAKLVLPGSTENFEVDVRVGDVVPAPALLDTRMRWEGVQKLVGVFAHSAQFEEGTIGRNTKDETDTAKHSSTTDHKTKDEKGQGQGKEDDVEDTPDPWQFHQGVVAELQDLSLHKHMRLFIGCGAVDERNWFYVLEGCSGAESLDGIIWRDVQDEKPWKDTDDLVSWNQRLQWLVDIASALRHIHQRGFVHANLRSTGVWVSHDLHLGGSDMDMSPKMGGAIDGQAGGQAPVRLRHAKVGEPLMVSQLHVHADVNATWAQSLQNDSAFLWMAPELLLHKETASPSHNGVTDNGNDGSSGYGLWRQKQSIHTGNEAADATRSSRDSHGQQGTVSALDLQDGQQGQGGSNAHVMPTRSPPEDIFALAVIGHELLCMTSPWRWARLTHKVQSWSNRHRDKEMQESRSRVELAVMHGARMPTPSEAVGLAPDRYAKFLSSCWRQSPSARPRIKRVVDFLATMVNSLNTSSQDALGSAGGKVNQTMARQDPEGIGHSLYYHNVIPKSRVSTGRWSLLSNSH